MCILYPCYYYYWTLKNSDNGRCITKIQNDELLPKQGKIESKCAHDMNLALYVQILYLFLPPHHAPEELHTNMSFV